MKNNVYNIYMEKNKLLNNIIKFIEKNGLELRQITDDEYEVYKNEDHMFLTLIEREMEIRSFSIPNEVEKGTTVFVKKNTESNGLKLKMFLDKIKFLSQTYSDNQIKAILRDMPLLTWYSQKKEVDLSNVAIIWRDHFLEENIGLLLAFNEVGVASHNIMALDKGDLTQHRGEITATFVNLGYEVDVFDNAYLTDYNYVNRITKKIQEFILKRDKMKVIIIDDGAIVSNILTKGIYNNVVAVIELTEMGLRRMQNVELKVPVFNIAKTRLKRAITYPEVANSIFIRIIELLGSEKLVGRTILLCGYGDMGEIIAERFRNYGANVVIYDKDIFRLIIAAERGFMTFRDPIYAVKNSNPFLVIGASGEKSITTKMIENLKDNAYVTAGATADLAVFREYDLDNKVDKRRKSKYATQYWINGKKVTMLGNGRSINLFNSEAIPNMSNDIFKTAALLTVCQIINHEFEIRSLKGINLSLVDKWIDESGVYDEYYSRYYDIGEKIAF